MWTCPQRSEYGRKRSAKGRRRQCSRAAIAAGLKGMPVTIRNAQFKLIDAKEAAELRGCKKTKLYADAAAGLLPPPIKLGPKCARWGAHELQAVVRARLGGANDEQVRSLVQELIAFRRELAPAAAKRTA